METRAEHRRASLPAVRWSQATLDLSPRPKPNVSRPTRLYAYVSDGARFFFDGGLRVQDMALLSVVGPRDGGVRSYVASVPPASIRRATHLKSQAHTKRAMPIHRNPHTAVGIPVISASMAASEGS